MVPPRPSMPDEYCPDSRIPRWSDISLKLLGNRKVRPCRCVVHAQVVHGRKNFIVRGFLSFPCTQDIRWQYPRGGGRVGIAYCQRWRIGAQRVWLHLLLRCRLVAPRRGGRIWVSVRLRPVNCIVTGYALPREDQRPTNNRREGRSGTGADPENLGAWSNPRLRTTSALERGQKDPLIAPLTLPSRPTPLPAARQGWPCRRSPRDLDGFGPSITGLTLNRRAPGRPHIPACVAPREDIVETAVAL